MAPRLVYGIGPNGELTMQAARPSKYRNVVVETEDADGKVLRYDSKAEARRHTELVILERCGEVKNLRRQVPYELLPAQTGERAVKYVADFVYEDEDGKTVVEDVKGKRTPEYILKRKLMLFRHGIAIKETK